MRKNIPAARSSRDAPVRMKALRIRDFLFNHFTSVLTAYITWSAAFVNAASAADNVIMLQYMRGQSGFCYRQGIKNSKRRTGFPVLLQSAVFYF